MGVGWKNSANCTFKRQLDPPHSNQHSTRKGGRIHMKTNFKSPKLASDKKKINYLKANWMEQIEAEKDTIKHNKTLSCAP